MPVTSLTMSFGPAIPSTVNEPGAISVLPARAGLEHSLSHPLEDSACMHMNAYQSATLVEQS